MGSSVFTGTGFNVLSFIVGIPSGRFFPFFACLYTRFSGLASMSFKLVYGGRFLFWGPKGPVYSWRFPYFTLVTSLIASTLALNEWVSIHCKALTLKSCRTKIALTIRA